MRGGKLSRFLGKNTIFNEHPVFYLIGTVELESIRSLEIEESGERYVNNKLTSPKNGRTNDKGRLIALLDK